MGVFGCGSESPPSLLNSLPVQIMQLFRDGLQEVAVTLLCEETRAHQALGLMSSVYM